MGNCQLTNFRCFVTVDDDAAQAKEIRDIMRLFKDKLGNDWNIEVDIPIRRKVLDDLKIDLWATFDGSLQQNLADPEKLGQVLFVLCQKQITERNLEPEAFAKLFSGDSIDDGRDALIGAVTDFFPSRQRQAMLLATKKATQAMDLATTKAMAELESMTPESILSQSSKSTSGSLPASSVISESSIDPALHSGNSSGPPTAE